MDVHPGSSDFYRMQALARNHAVDCIKTAFEYEKKRWDKSHKEVDIEIGDQVLISTIHFNNLNTHQKLKDPFIGPFVVVDKKGENAIEVDLNGSFSRRHPVFPVSLLKKYSPSDEKRFPQRKGKQKALPEINEEEAVIDRVLDQRRVGKGKTLEMQYLVRYKNKTSDFDRWVPVSEIKNAGSLLRSHRVEKRKEMP